LTVAFVLRNNTEQPTIVTVSGVSRDSSGNDITTIDGFLADIPIPEPGGLALGTLVFEVPVQADAGIEITIETASGGSSEQQVGLTLEA
jgi:hypothetical protein